MIRGHTWSAATRISWCRPTSRIFSELLGISSASPRNLSPPPHHLSPSPRNSQIFHKHFSQLLSVGLNLVTILTEFWKIYKSFLKHFLKKIFVNYSLFPPTRCMPNWAMISSRSHLHSSMTDSIDNRRYCCKRLCSLRYHSYIDFGVVLVCSNIASSVYSRREWRPITCEKCLIASVFNFGDNLFRVCIDSNSFLSFLMCITK